MHAGRGRVGGGGAQQPAGAGGLRKVVRAEASERVRDERLGKVAEADRRLQPLGRVHHVWSDSSIADLG